MLPVGCAKRNRAVIRELLPEPVLPTTPICGGMEKGVQYVKSAGLTASSILNINAKSLKPFTAIEGGNYKTSKIQETSKDLHTRTMLVCSGKKKKKILVLTNGSL